MKIFQQIWEKVGAEGQWNHNWSITLIPLGMNDFNSQNQTSNICNCSCYL